MGGRIFLVVNRGKKNPNLPSYEDYFTLRKIHRKHEKFQDSSYICIQLQEGNSMFFKDKFQGLGDLKNSEGILVLQLSIFPAINRDVRPVLGITPDGRGKRKEERE